MNGTTTEAPSATSASMQTTASVPPANGATTTTTTSAQEATATATATTSDDGAGLFSDDLVSPAVAAALPEGYRVRALRPADYHRGFLDCLRVLTTVGDIGEAQFAERFAWLARQDGSYYVLVVEDGAGRVVGTGALIAERKL